MNDRKIEILPVNDLWALREKLNAALAAKIITEKQEIERRLARLSVIRMGARRPYPKVHPKYFNPENPSQTWSGRGSQPRWLRGQLSGGKSIEDLRISAAA